MSSVLPNILPACILTEQLYTTFWVASVKLGFLVVPPRGLSVPQKYFGALQGASGVYRVGNSKVTLMLGTTGDIVPLK